MDNKAGVFNFNVDHMTLLVDPGMYKAAYAVFRIVFGVPKDALIYEKRKKWEGADQEVSMTFAVKIGENRLVKNSDFAKTVIAVVQPSEPESRPSHVRQMLEDRQATAHWQHIALGVDDLVAFHDHATSHGVNFITPILHDEREDLLQVFSGEWYLPDTKPTGLFFEFVERNPTPEALKKISEMDRQAWFRDRVFLGLYEEKEREYQSGKIASFLDFPLIKGINGLLEGKEVWEIAESDLEKVKRAMLEYAKARSQGRCPLDDSAGCGRCACCLSKTASPRT